MVHKEFIAGFTSSLLRQDNLFTGGTFNLNVHDHDANTVSLLLEHTKDNIYSTTTKCKCSIAASWKYGVWLRDARA